MNQPRRRIHRAFIQWMKACKNENGPVLIVEQRTDRFIRCRLTGFTDAMKVVVTNTLSVSVYRDGEWWDEIMGFECIPQLGVNGYICPLCVGEDTFASPDRETFWCSRLFEPLATWIETLKTMDWLLLYELPGGSSWALLHQGPVSTAKTTYLVDVIALQSGRTVRQLETDTYK